MNEVSISFLGASRGVSAKPDQQNVWTDGLKPMREPDMRNIGESIDKINTVVIDFPPDSAYLCFIVG
jgi:hypothetical protein